MKTITILQSCYIPWKGYFDLIKRSDLFVLYDCVQYTTYDWRNRNRIKAADGLHWLTVPIKYISQTQLICDTECATDSWQEAHWKTLHHAYARAPHFKELSPAIHALYQECGHGTLSEINKYFLEGINRLLGITTPLILQKQHVLADGDKTDKLLAICKYYGATHYLSGPSAASYLDISKFEDAGIKVEWMHYDYPEYSQMHPPFIHEVTILDLLFNMGTQAPDYIQGDSKKNV